MFHICAYLCSFSSKMRMLTTVHEPWQSNEAFLCFGENQDFSKTKVDVLFPISLILDDFTTFYSKMNVHEVIPKSLHFFFLELTG